MTTEPRTVDLAIVGAGASAGHTLLALLSRLSPTATSRPARILVVDRDPQFFSGVAYGHRSGRASLTLSTLAGFLPDDERRRFTAWVESHRDRLLPDADPAWVERHRADVTAGRWDGLFVPRRWYGEYLADRLRSAMRDAQAAGVAEVALLTAEVSSVDRSDGGLHVTARHDDGQTAQIDAAAVVLAIGSPSTRRLPAEDDAADGLFHDVYRPGLDATLSRLRDRLVELPVDRRRVLVVGGNASALEFVAAGQAVLRDTAARLTVLAPAGRPRNWRPRADGEVADLPAIEALRRTANGGRGITAAALHDAVVSDVRGAVRAGTDVAAVRELVAAVPHFLGHLDAAGRAELAARYGLRITSVLRQDCGDAVEILESAVAAGTVDFRAGRLLGCRPEGPCFRVTVRDDRGGERLLDSAYGAVVGAIGFERVSGTRAALLRRLLATGLVEPSSSDAGVRVDEGYRAAPGVFVVGPLLAGNAHPGWLVWHAESVRRIMTIASEASAPISRELILAVQSDLAGSVPND